MLKLIRNKIPTIAEQNGNRKGMHLVSFEPQHDQKLIHLFKEKIIEEAKEIMEAKNDIDLLYELADIHQVLGEFLEYLGVETKDLQTIMKAKAITNGVFMHEHTGTYPTKTKVFILDIKE